MEKLPEVLGSTIDVLATKFGAQGTQLFEMLVRGKQIESIGYALLGIVLLLISLFCYSKTDIDDSDTVGYAFVMSCCFVFGFFLISFDFVGIFAPEYALLTGLMR